MKYDRREIWEAALALSAVSFVGAVFFALFHYVVFAEQVGRLLVQQ